MTEKNKGTKVPIITVIQNELKAPKNQYNSFGKYKYRNAEDIEQAVKPLLEKYEAQLTFDEDLVVVGNRIYVQVTANYKDSEQEIHVKGHAREEEHKKGMDGSQITGSSSSYATKYALGKLFLIDDTKDADSEAVDTRSEVSTKRKQSKKKKTTKQDLLNYRITFNRTVTDLGTLLKNYNAGNKVAIDFANSLTGEDKFAFESLKQMS